MTRFAIDHLTALRIVREGVTVHPSHSLVAPNLLRSQALSHLYRGVTNGEIERVDAKRWLDGIATLRIRLLGDRVSRATAFAVAEEMGWPDTDRAEYVAVAKLQADAFITEDAEFARDASSLLTIAEFDALTRQ